ncbi:MAG: SDR family oxidoreductase [Cytophagales bacterium]|nr:SDR family oxidoreductase [Cytophagales bacterium]
MQSSFALYPDLADKRVVVTGGASGIGAAFVEAFAAQGAKVSFLDIADADGLALQDKLKTTKHPATFIHCDLTDLDALAQVFRAIEASTGATEILVNNAANDVRHNMADITRAQWDASVAVNLQHLYFCSQAVVPAMCAAGGGVILNLGSISWHLALPNLTLYMMAKAGIEAMTRGMARDFGPSNIRVNCIIPGAIKTPKQTLMWHTPEAEAKIFNGQCLKVRVEPEDVANMALFLASKSAAKCTGREYYIDAGYYGDGA